MRRIWGLFLILLLAGCTPVRPIYKLGLIAPFEGLYRESGYAALAGMRQAITDCTPPGMDVLPLALDDSGDPAQARRATEKLMVDPATIAVVGPFLLDNVPAVSEIMSATTATWYIPMLIAPTGEHVAPSSPAWLTSQIEFVANATAADRILLLNAPAALQMPHDTAIPTLRLDDLTTTLSTITDNDAILWLGRPEVGAQWYTVIHQSHPTVEFWLAMQAGTEIFAAHTANATAVHWLYWAPREYNQRSQPTNSIQPSASAASTAMQPTDALLEIAYHASCAALNAPPTTDAVTRNGELQGWPIHTPPRNER